MKRRRREKENAACFHMDEKKGKEEKPNLTRQHSAFIPFGHTMCPGSFSLSVLCSLIRIFPSLGFGECGVVVVSF